MRKDATAKSLGFAFLLKVKKNFVLGKRRNQKSKDEKYGAVKIWHTFILPTLHLGSKPTTYYILAMPCIVQPSGGGGKIHLRYTARRKHGLLATDKRLQEEGRPL